MPTGQNLETEKPMADDSEYISKPDVVKSANKTLTNYSVNNNELKTVDFIRLFESVGWCPPGEAQVTSALKNSLAVFSLYSDTTLIGMGRLLGDYAMSYYIKDFVVVPDFQKHNGGRFLLQAMLDYIAGQLPSDWKVSVELISAPGVEGFYRKFGFEDRPCINDGAGMCRMLTGCADATNNNKS